MAPLQERVALGLGWELDALVAERVMGWVRTNRSRFGIAPAGPVFWGPPDGEGSVTTVLPRFSTDIAAAFEVVDRMQGREYGWDLWLPNSAGFQRVAKVYNGSGEWTAKGDTLPEAICRAAIAARADQGERAGA